MWPRAPVTTSRLNLSSNHTSWAGGLSQSLRVEHRLPSYECRPSLSRCWPSKSIEGRSYRNAKPKEVVVFIADGCLVDSLNFGKDIGYAVSITSRGRKQCRLQNSCLGAFFSARLLLLEIVHRSEVTGLCVNTGTKLLCSSHCCCM